MPLEIAIYNRQKQTSAAGREYIGYVVAFAPGQRGAIPAAAEVPPFYVRDQRGGRQWIRLEARTLQDAKSEAIQQQHVLQAVSKGVHVIPASDGRARLADKVDEYLLEIEANRARKSWLAYKNTLENFFLNSCRKPHVDEINRQDILSFKSFLKSKCGSDRSIYNHFLNTMIFLKWAGHKVDISKKKGDWPDKSERVVEAYTNEQLEKLFQAAQADERLLLKAFLFTGFREGGNGALDVPRHRCNQLVVEGTKEEWMGTQDHGEPTASGSAGRFKEENNAANEGRKAQSR